MPDNIVLIVFGIICVAAFALMILFFAIALRYAKRTDGEFKMIFWGVAALASGILGICSFVYFLFPIILIRWL